MNTYRFVWSWRESDIQDTGAILVDLKTDETLYEGELSVVARLTQALNDVEELIPEMLNLPKKGEKYILEFEHGRVRQVHHTDGLTGVFYWLGCYVLADQNRIARELANTGSTTYGPWTVTETARGRKE